MEDLSLFYIWVLPSSIKSIMKRLFSIFKAQKQPASIDKAATKDDRESQEDPSRLETRISDSSFVAFDLEIAKIIPGDFKRWKTERPLGISCAALQFDGHEPELWYTKLENGDYSAKTSREDAIKLVDRLSDAVDKGWKIVTWNGLSFDFDVLAEESGCWEICKNLALSHVDMMFHFFCLQGYPLSLDKAAKGLGLVGKTEGMKGDLAPILWQEGKYSLVLDYVAQDVRTTLEVAKKVFKTKQIRWTSNRGRLQQVFFPHGWLSVAQALKLPLPDTSWMSDPMQRSEFYQWTKESNIPLPKKNTPDKPDTKTSSSLEENQAQSTRTHIKRILSEDEINAVFASCDSHPENIPREWWVEFDFLSKRLECTCPICMGAPNLDLTFLHLEELDKESHESAYYDDSYYDDEGY